MKITVEFLSLPNVVKMVGGRSITLDFSGQTIEELVSELANRHGQQLGRFLLDEFGRLDPAFRVVLNQKEWLSPDQMNRALKDGDRVTITMLVGGG